MWPAPRRKPKVMGVWGLRPQRVQGGALALPSLRPLPPVRRRQQRPHRRLGKSRRPMKDDERVRTMIEEHLAAGAAGRHDRDRPIDLVGLRMAHRHDGVDRAVTLEQRPAQRHRLGADRQPPHRRAEMQPGPDAPIQAADRRRDGVPERSVVPRQNVVRGGDQCMIGRGQAVIRGRRIIQPLRPPRPRPMSRAWRWPPRRTARARASRWFRPCRDARAGTAWRSRAPGRSAGCRN